MPSTAEIGVFDVRFRDELTASVPYMRAFARSLCHNAAQVDDIAQDALVRAWSARQSFTLGTNMRAWLTTIIRNVFYNERVKAARTRPLDDEVAARTLIAVDNPDAVLELDDLRRALTQLELGQREALLLVAAAGFSYEDAALALDVPIGTIKSRVNRGRSRLAQLLSVGDRSAMRNTKTIHPGEHRAA